MYLEDVTDLNELLALLAEVEDELLKSPSCQQSQWDKEDILDRIDALTYPILKLRDSIREKGEKT